MKAWVKGLLSGVIGALVTFITAYLSYVSDNDIKDFIEISTVTWSVMGAGALLQMLLSWKLLLTERPRD